MDCIYRNSLKVIGTNDNDIILEVKGDNKGYNQTLQFKVSKTHATGIQHKLQKLISEGDD